MDYLYEKAPLVEVIAEIHWALKKIDTAPDAKIDPYYDLFKDEFLAYMKLEDIQELVPNIVPLEILPNQPRLRLRSAPGQWPLAQLGPGIITANIVPPYNGWKSFEPFLHKLVEGLLSKYPVVEKTLRIDKLHLRYIDAFDENFGFSHYAEFASKMLGINLPLSEDFINLSVKKGTDVTYLLENRFLNATPEGSSGTLKLSPGQKNNKSALIMELVCESIFVDNSATDCSFLKKWFDEAHNQLRIQFDTLATQELKDLMGKQRKID